MPVVSSWDWVNRRIYIGEAQWHPIDLYREYRAIRSSDEYTRQFAGLLSMSGAVPKGGGRFTPRYMTLLEGTKIVPLDASVAPITTILGEVLTDDQSPFIDTTLLVNPPQIDYQPAEAELITVDGGSGGICEPSPEYSQSLLDILNALQGDPAASLVIPWRSVPTPEPAGIPTEDQATASANVTMQMNGPLSQRL